MLMSIKKKLGLGVASGALGLAMIGGGTWAAFSDTEKTDNIFKTGTLDLGIAANGTVPMNFDLQNLKPGDSMQREIVLSNKGTLAIKNVLLDTVIDVTDGGANLNGDSDLGGVNTDQEILDQFNVELLYADYIPGASDPVANFKLIEPSHGITLHDLDTFTSADWAAAGIVHEGDYLNVAPVNTDGAYTGIPVVPSDNDKLVIKITFKGTAGNEFMNDKADVTFNFTANQWGAKEHTSNDGANGAGSNINERAGSED
jgi:spore coat-associated protein N